MKIILLLIAVMLLMVGADARYSPGLEIAEGENITGSGGIIINMSTDYYITPEFFGAAGDNITDDTVALQNAITYSAHHNVKVVLGPKTYNFSDELQLYPGTIIEGIGGYDTWQITGHQSCLRYTGSGVALNMSNSTGGYNYKFKLSGLMLLGPGQYVPASRAGTAIYAVNVSEFEFDDVSVVGFGTGLYGHDLTIGLFDGCQFSHNTLAINASQFGAVTFTNCNIYSNNIIFKPKTVINVRFISNQIELFDYGIYINSSEYGPVYINSLGFIGNSINVETSYFTESMESENLRLLGHIPYNAIWSQITDGGAYHTADKNIKMYNNYYIGNDFRVYYTNWLFNFDVQDYVDHGSLMDLGAEYNTFSYTNTSVINVYNATYALVWWQHNKYLGCAAIESGAKSIVRGVGENWYGIDVIGGLRLSQSAGYAAGNIWYDSGSRKIKFFDGSVARTVTST